MTKLKIFILSTLLLVSVSAFSQSNFNGSFCNSSTTITLYVRGTCRLERPDATMYGTYIYEGSQITMKWSNGYVDQGYVRVNRDTHIPSSIVIGNVYFQRCD